MKIRLEVTNDAGEKIYAVQEVTFHADSSLDPWRKIGNESFYFNLEQIIDGELVYGVDILPRISAPPKVSNVGDK